MPTLEEELKHQYKMGLAIASRVVKRETRFRIGSYLKFPHGMRARVIVDYGGFVRVRIAGKERDLARNVVQALVRGGRRAR